ncbi:trypsin-like cysteine/serine peptidase domain-containing protein [Globomyces pollinis-pini]|nr:trypsin-like cysteine/serine peptidase domain-containing protein [Globomyces pollinis-pini]
MKLIGYSVLASAILALPADKPIVGGTPVGSPDVYPWLVALRKNGRGFCGGSLISPNKIVTAAHCTVNQVPENFLAYYHRYNFNTTVESENATTLKVNKFTIHPNYTSASRSGYDVAIWDVEVLSGPVPTQFAKLDDGSLAQEGQSLKIAGWGTVSSGGSAPLTMLETVVPITSNQACFTAYPQLQNLTSTTFCAGFPEGGKDTCQGDSGGPAFVSNEDGTATVTGLTSFGRGCALAGYPGVYASVGSLYSWIVAN